VWRLAGALLHARLEARAPRGAAGALAGGSGHRHRGTGAVLRHDGSRGGGASAVDNTGGASGGHRVGALGALALGRLVDLHAPRRMPVGNATVRKVSSTVHVSRGSGHGGRSGSSPVVLVAPSSRRRTGRGTELAVGRGKAHAAVLGVEDHPYPS
jgi:hypothetical protein